MSFGKRIALVVLAMAVFLPWIASAIYWYPSLSPDLPVLERVILAAGYWILKPLAMLAILAADSR
jgi:hypothetical protein